MRVLRILQRNLSSCDRSVKARAYLSLVRPIVEYATVAWSPHTNKGIDCVESVQHRAARFVNSDYSRYSSVSSMLTDLNWPSLWSYLASHAGVFRGARREEIRAPLKTPAWEAKSYPVSRGPSIFLFPAYLGRSEGLCSQGSAVKAHGICNLGMFFKIHRGQVNISLPYDLTSVPAYGRTRASHDFKVRLPSSSVDAYKQSFYVRSIPAWNALSSDVVS